MGVEQGASLVYGQRADLVREVTLIPDLPARVIAQLLASRGTGNAPEDNDVAACPDLSFFGDLPDGCCPERYAGSALPGRRRAVIVGPVVVDSLLIVASAPTPIRG